MCITRKKIKLQHKGLASVGDAYWKAFLKRNNHFLDSDTGTTQVFCSKEWSNHLNNKNMYNPVYDVMDDPVYDVMDEAGVLKKLEEPVWMNLNEDVVESKKEANGKKVRYKVKYP